MSFLHNWKQEEGAETKEQEKKGGGKNGLWLRKTRKWENSLI